MYLITGGAGFIGSNIAAQMEKRGIGPIVIVDRLREQEKWRNLANRELFEIVHPDNIFQFLDEHSRKLQAIIHMGAISATTEVDADLLFKINFQLSLRLWDWSVKHKIQFIYASSAATYGDGSLGFEDNSSPEFLAKLKPMNAYGWSKHQFDRRIARKIENNEPSPQQWVGLKFFNVYGPNEYHKGRMSSVVSQAYPFALRGKPFKLFKSDNPNYEDGGQLRDFIWVGDCVEIILWFLEKPSVSGLYNCGSGNARSFLDLVQAVYRILGKKISIEFVETPEDIRKNYQYFTEANIQRLRDSGYVRPMTTLEDGVQSYLVNFLNSDDPYC